MIMKKLLALIIAMLMANTYAQDLLTPLPNTPDAPDFLLRDLNEKIYELENFEGKPLIVNFWATWCPPCRKEMPSMNRAWEKIKDEGINMVAINYAEDEESVRAYIKKHPVDFTILLDESGEEFENWSIRGLPTTLILDPKGHVVYQAVGDREWDNDKLLDMIRKLRTQKTEAKKEKPKKDEIKQKMKEKVKN